MNLNNEDIEKYMLNRQMLPTSGPDFAEDDEDEEDDDTDSDSDDEN